MELAELTTAYPPLPSPFRKLDDREPKSKKAPSSLNDPQMTEKQTFESPQPDASGNKAAENGAAEKAEAWLAMARRGEISWTELAERMFSLGCEATQQGVTPDLDRQRRCGRGEVIYGEGKSVASIQSAAQRILAREKEVLVTRVDPADALAISAPFPYARYRQQGRTLRLANQQIDSPEVLLSKHQQNQGATPLVAVVSAGTTDWHVAEEALETLTWMEVPAVVMQDCGVAGAYRLLGRLETLRQASVVIVVAGMEGALASFVGGLVAVPVIAVPTSVGYGANLEGITTLLAMISSCAAGVTVVNINAGFKAGYIAGLFCSEVAKGLDRRVDLRAN